MRQPCTAHPGILAVLHCRVVLVVPVVQVDLGVPVILVVQEVLENLKVPMVLVVLAVLVVQNHLTVLTVLVAPVVLVVPLALVRHEVLVVLEDLCYLMKFQIVPEEQMVDLDCLVASVVVSSFPVLSLVVKRSSSSASVQTVLSSKRRTA